MKFLARFYYLPFLIGIIISTLLFILSNDAKLKVEGYAKIDANHTIADRISALYWETVTKDIIEKYNNQSITIYQKRGMLRFYSKNNDIEEIKKNYQDIKNEFKKYKKIYLINLENRIIHGINSTTLTKKMKKKIKNGKKYMSDLSEKEFLLDLKTNEVVIRNNQIIYISLLLSFLLSIILYNIKNI